MKNSKGFTLAELLGVLTLLAIIALITVPLVNKYVTNSRQKAYDAEISTLKTAAQQWFVKNSASIEWDENGYYALNLDDLKQSEFLADEVIYNPLKPDEEITGCIMINNSDGNYSYTYSLNCVILVNYTFQYTGSVQSVTIPAGTYKLEVWGAEGGGSILSSNSSSGYGGKGGYSVGTLTVNATTTLNAYVGGYGLSATSGVAAGGYNGGGSGYASESGEPGNGGGGATDIRIGGISLYQRVIVAGGGGGGGEDDDDDFGYGGGTTGVGYSSYDATQTYAGDGGTFGLGGTTDYGDGGGGGGGWYGGGTLMSQNIGDDTQGGGGGSGWIYTASTFANWQDDNSTDAANWLLNSGNYLTSAQTIAGNQKFKDPDGSTVTGHSGNGYAKITQIS